MPASLFARQRQTTTLRRMETALLFFGSLMMAMFVLALVDRAMSVRAEIADFRSLPAKSPSAPLPRRRAIDFRYWSESRIQAYFGTISAQLPPPLALLRISKVNLEVPVLEGTGEIALNRGVGHIPGTAHPGEPGNVGLVGHRDSFFRVLQDIETGDSIELQTSAQILHYRVMRIAIVDPTDVTVLQPQQNESLTLITCYPFHFLGSAPKRFVVQASLISSPTKATAATLNTDSIRVRGPSTPAQRNYRP